jgi:pSer/pThr/pTyr-binding forkhead associated (FHA) protein
LVSGVHALIESDNERVCVRDLDSTNGTYLDNEQLQGETAKYLSAGKKLILASSGPRGCQLRFEKVTESRTSATIHKRDETVTE